MFIGILTALTLDGFFDGAPAEEDAGERSSASEGKAGWAALSALLPAPKNQATKGAAKLNSREPTPNPLPPCLFARMRPLSEYRLVYDRFSSQCTPTQSPSTRAGNRPRLGARVLRRRPARGLEVVPRGRHRHLRAPRT